MSVEIPISDKPVDEQKRLKKLLEKADQAKSGEGPVMGFRVVEEKPIAKPVTYKPSLILSQEEYEVLLEFCHRQKMKIGKALHMMVREYLESLDFPDKQNPLHEESPV